MSLRFTIFDEIFAFVHLEKKKNLIIEVVTFRLHGSCMLDLLSLPAFTRLGHECQDLLSPYNGMHVCTD